MSKKKEKEEVKVPVEKKQRKIVAQLPGEATLSDVINKVQELVDAYNA